MRSSREATIKLFLLCFGMLLVLMLYYGIRPGWSILLVPPLVGITMVAALGIGTLLAALNVAFRDFKYTIPFLLQLWIFATPTVDMQLDQETTNLAAAPVVQSESTAAAAPVTAPRSSTP